MSAESISLVTAEHHTPFVVKCLKKLKSQRFSLPIVYNTSGWISKKNLDELLDFVDIWLWDIKTLDENTAKKFCRSDKYPFFAKDSFEYLYSNLFKRETHKQSKVIVRHLVFPSSIRESIDVIRYFAPFKDKCMFSLMAQFINPYSNNKSNNKSNAAKNEKFNKITQQEYNLLENEIFKNNIEEGFIQEIGDENTWIPDFTKDNPFPSDYAMPCDEFLQLRRLK